ncbi:hypothetical protein TNCV_742471 [Trichonephila clavipes]|nr:hypothetical protein TNCV_742471 [Trichonephila clavipes]
MLTRSSGNSSVTSQPQANQSTVIPPQTTLHLNQNPNANLNTQSLQGIISALTALTVQINSIDFNTNPPQAKFVKNKNTKKRELYALVEAILDNDHE